MPIYLQPQDIGARNWDIQGGHQHQRNLRRPCGVCTEIGRVSENSTHERQLSAPGGWRRVSDREVGECTLSEHRSENRIELHLQSGWRVTFAKSPDWIFCMLRDLIGPIRTITGEPRSSVVAASVQFAYHPRSLDCCLFDLVTAKRDIFGMRLFAYTFDTGRCARCVVDFGRSYSPIRP